MVEHRYAEVQVPVNAKMRTTALRRLDQGIFESRFRRGDGDAALFSVAYRCDESLLISLSAVEETAQRSRESRKFHSAESLIYGMLHLNRETDVFRDCLNEWKCPKQFSERRVR